MKPATAIKRPGSPAPTTGPGTATNHVQLIDKNAEPEPVSNRDESGGTKINLLSEAKNKREVEAKAAAVGVKDMSTVQTAATQLCVSEKGGLIGPSDKKAREKPGSRKAV